MGDFTGQEFRVGGDKALLLATEDSLPRAFSWEQRNLPAWTFSPQSSY